MVAYSFLKKKNSFFYMVKPIVKGPYIVCFLLLQSLLICHRKSKMFFVKNLATEWHQRWNHVGNVKEFRVCTGHTLVYKALYKSTLCPVFSKSGSGFRILKKKKACWQYMKDFFFLTIEQVNAIPLLCNETYKIFLVTKQGEVSCRLRWSQRKW